MKRTNTQKITFALLYSISTVLAADSAFAVSENYPVVQREKHGGFEVAPIAIDGLKARDQFETEHFRVSYKKEEAALTLDRISGIVAEKKKADAEKPPTSDEARVTPRDEETLKLLAANVLYHAEKARAFFVDVLKSEEVKKMEQIVVRLDLTNRYSQFERFTNDNYQPQFNNALSIEGGTPFKPKPGLNPWGREMWFRPRKEIPIGELLAQMPEDPANAQLRQARQTLYPMQIDLVIRDTLYAIFQGRLTTPSFIDSVTRQTGTLILMEGAFQVLKVVNRFLIPQKFYLDTALVPEIVYHEFSHLALSDSMKPDVSTPVNEGMADFFAASIGGSPKLAKKIKEFSTAVGKNGKKRQFFQIEYESLGKAQSDFVLGLLWGLREKLGETYATQVVFGARKFLNTKDSDIRDGLVRALLRSCDTSCESPLRDRMVIHQFLQDRGL